MSNTIRVFDEQTIFDVAMQYTGSITNAYPIFLHNLSVGIMSDFDDDISNTQIEIPDDLQINNAMLSFFSKKHSIIINK